MLLYWSLWEAIVFGGRPLIVPSGLEGMRDRTVTAGWVSLEQRMIGWRVGWMVAHAQLAPTLAMVHIYNGVVTSGFGQVGAAAALRIGDGPQKRRHDHVARLDRVDVRADVLDHPDEFVARTLARFGRFHRLVRPQVAPADRRPPDTHERICCLNQMGIWDGIDANVAGAVHQGRLHGENVAGNGRLGRVKGHFRTLVQVSALGLPRNRPVDGAPMTSGRQWRLKY
jgi:hypothetical protein